MYYFILYSLVFITGYLIYLYITRNYDYWKVRNVDFIKPTFPFGNFANTLIGRENLGFLLQRIYNLSKENYVGFWIFGTPYLLIRSPEIIKQVLVKDFNYFYDRTMFSDSKIDPIGTNTIFIQKNPEWKHTRAKMTPMFTTNKLKGMISLVSESAGKMLVYIENNCHKPIDCKELCAKFTTESISSTTYGVASFCFDVEDAPFRKVGRDMFSPTFQNGFRFLSYFLAPNVVKMLSLPIYNKKSTDFLSNVFWETIKHREISKEKRNDLIDIIIEIKNDKKLSDELKFEGDVIVAQALQFYIAGFETTSSTLSYIFYELVMNPDVQSLVRDEVMGVYSRYGEFNYESLLDMKYLDNVISETLRKYPPLPFLDRRCIDNYQVPDSDLVIERGTPIFISMLGLHYDPEYFPEPNKFDPDRFNEDNSASRSKFSFLSFGHGPRNCIGERFGIAMTKICAANILKEYILEECSQTPKHIAYNQFTIILQPLKGLPIKFRKIVKQFD